MTRRDSLLHGLDLARDIGLEIGALDHPLVRKTEGAISYIDYADAGYLRQKYANDANVVGADIVEVDAVWGGASVAEALAAANLPAEADYVLASHVVEHVPDLVTWLAELRAVLRPGGTIRLAVPDARYTFDALREPSRVSDAVTAHMLRARAPLTQHLIDSCLNHHWVDRAAQWDGTATPPRYRPPESLAHALHAAGEALAQGTYIDVHCWVFTPLSFCRLMEQLCALGLVRLACARFHDTLPGEDEFIAILRQSDDLPAILASWRDEGDRIEHALAKPVLLGEALAEVQAQQAALSAQLAALSADLANGLTAVERRTAPLAWALRRLLHRLGVLGRR